MSITPVANESLPTAVGVSYLAFLSSFPPEHVLGAFTGSVIFLLGVTNKPKWTWLMYFIVAFVAGLLGAQLTAEMVNGALHLLHIETSIHEGFGALFAAACTINVIGWLRDHPGFFWTRKQGDQT